MSRKWISLHKEIKNCLTRITNEKSLEPENESREGPGLVFGGLQFRSNGFLLEYRPSITICVPPNKSKIWSRCSLIQSSNGNLDAQEIHNFFSTCSEYISGLDDIVYNSYRKILVEEGFYEEVSKGKKISLKFVASMDPEFAGCVSSLLAGEEIDFRAMIKTDKEMRNVAETMIFWQGWRCSSWPEIQEYLEATNAEWAGLAGEDTEGIVLESSTNGNGTFDSHVGICYDQRQTPPLTVRDAGPARVSKAFARMIGSDN